MYKYLFGPVPSRRLGMSLGIDLVPKKVCSLDCIYCEVGKTTKLTLERMEYVLFEKIKAELEDYFAKGNPDPDYFTFSGSGEPTLNSRIGDVLDFLKEKRPDVPVSVLTNGTLLYDQSVRASLLKADLVLPSLDAALQGSYDKIDVPADGLTLDKYIDGLVEFRKEFKGKIFLEIFILEGYNDSDEDIQALKDAVHRIQPDRVQLNTLDRPGTVAELEPASFELMHEIAVKLDYHDVEVIASSLHRRDLLAFRTDVEAVILETIARRPCTLDDLAAMLGLHINEINKYLDVLEGEAQIERVLLERGWFYKLKKKPKLH
ncbi:MAG: radical SAM protein [Spirochaetales bacterium]|nr:radical SAM protein [Spirochaetales bacterium]